MAINKKILEELQKNLDKSCKVDPIHPSQYFHATRSKSFGEGEKKLMVAIMKDALECYIKNVDNKTAYGQRLFGETEGWFWQDDLGYLYSFRSICLWLNFDHDWIRSKLTEIKRVVHTN